MKFEPMEAPTTSHAKEGMSVPLTGQRTNSGVLSGSRSERLTSANPLSNHAYSPSGSLNSLVMSPEVVLVSIW